MKHGKSIKGALYYNEQKVQRDDAELLLASRFGCDVTRLSFTQKLKRFESRISKLNQEKTNTLHISLNFSPSDHLSTSTLQNIATDYMEKIGFGGQPYLVYRHDDTAHPHLHIVTTTIKANGKLMNIHNIAKLKSEPARKTIEEEYGLIKAEEQRKQKDLDISTNHLRSAQYGTAATKSTISNIVREVVARYKFSSIEELNAILKTFNMVADNGGPATRMRQRGGLVYSMLDKHGYKIGIPVKASTIYTKPTLSLLQKKFARNRIGKSRTDNYFKRAVDNILYKSQPISRSRFESLLAVKNIFCHFTHDRNGQMTSVLFVDHTHRTVCNSLDIGIPPAALQSRFVEQKKVTGTNLLTSNATLRRDSMEHFKSIAPLEILASLMAPEFQPQAFFHEPTKKKKKRRKPKW